MTMLGHCDLPAELLLQEFGECLCGKQFPMHHEGVRRDPGETSGPAQQRFLVGMRREAVHAVDRGTYRDVLAENAYPLSALDQATAKCPLRLEAGKQDAAFSAWQVVAQVTICTSGSLPCRAKRCSKSCGMTT